MTPEELAKLDAIESKLKSLLETASKRTPGRWHLERQMHDVCAMSGMIAVTRYLGNRENELIEHHANAAFIADCAGPAEAGWRATLSSIEAFKGIAFVEQPEGGKPVPDLSYFGLQAAQALRSIIAEWEVIL